jgi:hypothetical protein
MCTASLALLSWSALQHRGERCIVEQSRATNVASKCRDRAVAGNSLDVHFWDVFLRGARHEAGAQAMRCKISFEVCITHDALNESRNVLRIDPLYLKLTCLTASAWHREGAKNGTLVYLPRVEPFAHRAHRAHRFYVDDGNRDLAASADLIGLGTAQRHGQAASIKSQVPHVERRQLGPPERPGKAQQE